MTLYGYGVIKLCISIVRVWYGSVMYRNGSVLKLRI